MSLTRSCLFLIIAIALTISPIASAEPAETAWQAMVRANPDLADDVTLGRLERAVLNVLSPDQYDAFVDGADPASLELTSGETGSPRTLADFLEEFATKAAVTEGLVYYPLPRCIVLETWSSIDGKMISNENRDFIVRGEATDLSDQGGSATGCGVPMAAEALMVNFRVSDHGSGSGQLRVNARDQGAGYPLIHYQPDSGLITTNVTALDLCLQASCTSDFRVRTKNAGAHVRMDILGYFAPLGTGGLNTDGTTSTGELTITGLDCSGNANGGALTADASGVVSCSDDEGDDDLGDHTASQNLDLDTFKLIGNGGSNGLSIAADGTVSFDGNLTTTARTTTQALTINGLDCSGNLGGGALTADASGVVSCTDDDVGAGGDDLGSHTATQNLDLDTFKLVGNGGTDGISIAADGTVSFDVPLTGLDLDMGSLTQTPGDPVQVGSLDFGFGSSPESVFVSGRYAYVIDHGFDDLKVIDISNPSAPSLAGSLAIGSSVDAIFVSGRYAYVVDRNSDDLKVIDVSNPSAPSLAGSLGIGTAPKAVHVSGRYAYVVDSFTNDLKVIDVSDPSAPSLAGSLAIGSIPASMFVSGRYAYVVDSSADDLKVIDISDPNAPTLAGSLEIGSIPVSVYVSGRYAYVIDSSSRDLKVIDVSDPSDPNLAGSLAIGALPKSVFVSGRYAYVVDASADDLRVIDVSDPSALSTVGSLALGGTPNSVFVSGRYAYVVDAISDDLKVIDVSGAELASANIHSLEAGSLQVRESLTAQGQLAVNGGVNIGSGGLFSDGNVGVSGTIAIANDVAPTSSPANLVQLYAEDNAGSSELKVRDEAGNVTTLSPHNFSLIGEASEPLAWSYYSENNHGRINVDMLRTVRLVEEISGEKLVHTETEVGSDAVGVAGSATGLRAQVEALKAQTLALSQENRELKALLCLDHPQASICQRK